MQKQLVTRSQRLRNIVHGHAILFRFLFVDGCRLLAEVAFAYDNPRTVADGSVTAARSSRWLLFRRDVIDGYNRRYEEARLAMRELVHNRGQFVQQYVAPLFAVRIATTVAAAFLGIGATVAVSLLQFVVAPYSFFAAVAAWIGVVPFLAVHFAFFAVVQSATSLLYAHVPVIGHWARLPIDNTFIIAWLVLDQALCLLLCYWSPVGKPVRVPFARIAQSMWYGFINAKTYWLILLLCLRGLQIDVLAIVVVACTPSIVTRVMYFVSRRLLRSPIVHWSFPSVMFYHYHRMVHLPGPYNEAHRHHHYLADATAFDAHMSGTGMAEEWFKLMTEIGLCLVTGLVPWSFTLPIIWQSVSNKIGHTRLEGEHPVTDNFHVNHHLKHFRNFGYAAFPLDLLCDTALGDVSGLGNLQKSPQRCTKQEEPDHYVLMIESLSPGAPVVLDAPQPLPLH